MVEPLSLIYEFKELFICVVVEYGISGDNVKNDDNIEPSILPDVVILP